MDWIKAWRESPEFEAVQKEINNIVSTRKEISQTGVIHTHEFAATTYDQTILLTKRMWLNYWRSPSYGYGNFFTIFSTAIVAGFTFWKLGNTLIAFQERLFGAFMFIFLPAPILNSVVPKVFPQQMVLIIVLRSTHVMGIQGIT
jgi:ATP-binding cassette, subfamily G (WHITE), member 2, SNQ2